MVSKKQIKFVKSLQQKKYRNVHRLFIVEGIKLVHELLASGFSAIEIYVTSEEIGKKINAETTLVGDIDLKKMSALNTPNGILGVFEIPEQRSNATDWTLALDAVRDPGNLGTIIRLCDWFGISQLICSEDTVDCYNPKVLQATMGSIARVSVLYVDLEEYLSETSLPIFGAFMDGANIYDVQLPQGGILIMGNEANGISKQVEIHIEQKITIPQFGKLSTESLNVATATAVLLSEIRRR